VFICNWIKKRRRPRANNVTLKLEEEEKLGRGGIFFFSIQKKWAARTHDKDNIGGFLLEPIGSMARML
jgi:hypothetical protein